MRLMSIVEAINTYYGKLATRIYMTVFASSISEQKLTYCLSLPQRAPADVWFSDRYPVYSLVPRPFPPPVFDRILYAKTEGEGLGERVTCVTSGRREGRH